MYIVSVFDSIIYSLSRIRDYIDDFTGWCSRHASEWAELYIIGPYITAILWYFYDVSWSVRWVVIDLRSSMRPLGTFLSDIENGPGLTSLLNMLWPEWSAWISAPWHWIRVQVWYVSIPLFYFLDNPILTINEWIEDGLLAIGAEIGDITDKVLDIVFPLGTDWYWFRQDPGYMIEFWFTSRFPGLSDFLVDMDGWVQARIPDVVADPREWIEDHLLEVIENVILKDWGTR